MIRVVRINFGSGCSQTWQEPIRPRAHTREHTHLLRNILSNYWCGMHLTCTNNPVKLTGMFGRFEVRNLSEVFWQLSSDAAQTTVPSWRHRQNSDCENRIQGKNQVWLENWFEIRLGGSWVEPLPISEKTHECRYVELIRLHISRGIALFVGQPAMLTRLPPCV